jgi:hypothetical protein
VKLARAIAAATTVLLAGCAMHFVGEAPPGAGSDASSLTVVTGRINYVVDGRSMAPYGAFRPAWPAPRFTALRLESGDPFVTPAVADADGAFRWNLPPGSYVISRIGTGQFHDDTYIAWPRVAFFVPPSPAPVYLGHLVLDGTTRSGSTTLSTGRVVQERGVSFRMVVRDEGEAGPKSLMFHDAGMPIGEGLLEEWRKSRRAVIERIFGKSAQRIPE